MFFRIKLKNIDFSLTFSCYILYIIIGYQVKSVIACGSRISEG